MSNEKRLIDADALDKKLEAIKIRFRAQGRDTVAEDYNFVQTVLLTAPTVDAVEVVRCKDCIHWDSETGWCNNHSAFDDNDMDWNIYNDDDFCSCGERRTENA